MHRLLVIDPANTSGVAVFNADGNLERCFVVRAMGKKGKYLAGGNVFSNMRDAWFKVYDHCKPGRVIIERGFGSMSTAIDSQGMHYGMHRVFCAFAGLPEPARVNVSEWRRVIKESHAVSWPRESERCKELSISLCLKIWGNKITADEADACLLGLAAIRMGMAEIAGGV
jgi:hypothetical protein